MRFLGVIGLAVAACHGAANGPVGNPAGDATIDVAVDTVIDSPTDAQVGPITVIVYGDFVDTSPDNLVSGAHVYFMAPDGAAQLILTGNDGVATAVAPANTTALIVHTDGQIERRIHAYSGLLPGDSIVDGDPRPPGTDSCIGGTNVTFPAYSDATLYDARTSCSTGTQASGTTLPISCVIDCPQVNAANAVVYATDTLGNLGYSSLVDVDLTMHFDATKPIVLPAFQPASTITGTFTNLPQGTTYVELAAGYTRGSDPVKYGFVDVTTFVAGSSASITSPIVPFGDTTQLGAQLTISGYNPVDYHQQLAQLLPTVQLDAAAMIHPATGGYFDDANQLVAWTEGSAGVDAPSMVTTQLSWRFSTILVTLTFTAPHGATTSLAVPKFPADLAQLEPSPGQVMYRGSDVRWYVGRTYHDALVGQTGAAPMWHTTF